MSWFRFKKLFDFSTEIQKACLEFSKECGYKLSTKETEVNAAIPETPKEESAVTESDSIFKSPFFTENTLQAETANIDRLTA